MPENLSRALWVIYNRTENPADFVRADEQMMRERATAKDGEVEGYGGGGVIAKALAAIPGGNKVFPKPQRMFPEGARPPGGEYINAATGEAITGQKPARAVIGVTPEGKAVFLTDTEQVDITGSPGPGSTKTKTNLFKQQAGWKWSKAPEGYENVPTIVSAENRGQHYYGLGADFPKGVDLERYANAASEPRLRPTTQGNVYPGEQVGSIDVRGREHPVYDMLTIRNLLVGTGAGAGAAGAATMPEDVPHKASGGLINRDMTLSRDGYALPPPVERDPREMRDAAEYGVPLPSRYPESRFDPIPKGTTWLTDPVSSYDRPQDIYSPQQQEAVRDALRARIPEAYRARTMDDASAWVSPGKPLTEIEKLNSALRGNAKEGSARQRVSDFATGVLDLTPIGAISNTLDAVKHGDYGDAASNALGMIPGGYKATRALLKRMDEPRFNREFADGGAIEDPGLVDRALSFLSQFNPVGSAEAAPVGKLLRGMTAPVAKQTFRGTDLVAKDPMAATSLLSKRDTAGAVDFGQGINNAEYTFTRKGDLQPWKEFDPLEIYKERGVIAGLLGDRSAAGSIVHDINGVKLTEPVNRVGGGEFQRSTEGPEVWASRPGAVKNMYTRITKGMDKLGVPRDAPVLANHVIMGTPGIDSTQSMAKAILRQIEPTRGQIDPMAAETFDAAVRKKYPTWPGILNPAEAERFLSGKEVGKRTSHILQHLDKAGAQAGGLPNLGTARFAMMEPRLVSADQGSTGFALSRLDPNRVTNAASHDTYPVGMLGPTRSAEDYVGGTRQPIPLDVMFPDWWKGVKPTWIEKKSGLTKATTPTMIQQSVLTQVPVQRASQEWLDNLMSYIEKNPKPWGYRLGGPAKRKTDAPVGASNPVGGNIP
jgi:hypothetical protein